MASPSWFFDGDKLRIYEVPPNSQYTTDVNGYRVYLPIDIPNSDSTLFVDIQKDLWSRWVDWNNVAKWSFLVFTRSGGSSRGFDQYGQEKFQSVDFSLLVSVGWRIVLSDYHHEVIFAGNLYSDDGSGDLFDHDRSVSIPAPIPRFEGFADLLTYRTSTGGPTPAEIANEVWEYTR